MNPNPHNLKFPTPPAISVRAFMEIQAILAELPDDAERSEVEAAQMKIDIQVGYGHFDVDLEQQGKHSALLVDLVAWLTENEPEALADFIGDRAPETHLPEITN